MLKHYSKRIGMGLLTLWGAALAQAPANLPPASLEMVITGDKGSEFQLEVRQMPLVQVLKTLTQKTGIPIHYSILPEGVVTATCVGASLKPVLECLLNRKADIIVRFAHGKNAQIEHSHIAEAWVLGAKLDAMPNSALCTAQSAQALAAVNSVDGAAYQPPSKPDQSDLLLDISKKGSAADRAQAIGDLLAIGRHNDPQVKAILEQAVHDADPGVRAQAISTLTHRDDYRDNATEIIREALQDDSVDVRIMAVDGIVDDALLLRQAMNDADETVSSLAKVKLDELLAKQKK